MKNATQLLLCTAALVASSVFAVTTAHGQSTHPSTGMLSQSRPGTLMAPIAQPCRVNQLKMIFRTGNDDLRGGQNNLNVEVHFRDGSMQKADNVNHGATWKNDSVSTVVIPLNRQVSPSEIRQIRLVHLAQGGYMGGPTQGSFGAALATPAGPLAAAGSMATGVKSEDNWTMEDFQAMAIGPNNITIPIASAPMHRFTGSDPSMDIDTRGDASCPAADAVRELEFVFHTGNDDLRGGNDNVGITIQFADGTSQTAANVNEGRNWANGSTHSLTVILNRPVPRKQIKSVTLWTTFTGGSGGDNWNMDSVEITADGHPLVTSGFHRFSADWSGPKAKQLTIAIPMS